MMEKTTPTQRRLAVIERQIEGVSVRLAEAERQVEISRGENAALHGKVTVFTKLLSVPYVQEEMKDLRSAIETTAVNIRDQFRIADAALEHRLNKVEDACLSWGDVSSIDNWHVTFGRRVYEGDRFVCECRNAGDANRIVKAMNGSEKEQ